MAMYQGKSLVARYAKELQRTSSLNDYAICDLCGKREDSKQIIAAHLNVCEASRTCSWCNIVFKNRGNLITHTMHIHGKKTSETSNILPATYTCTVCPKAYRQGTNLKYHIRREHYNLLAKKIEGEHRDLNEVWLERVLNSDAVIEIRKVKRNMYLMRRATASDSLQITEPTDYVDLTPMYPTHVRRDRVWCEVCKKSYCQQFFQKHLNEKHNKIRLHDCNNCNRSFPRAYLYLQHKCMRKSRWMNHSTKLVDNVTLVD